MDSGLAPIAFFAYNRPFHAYQSLSALKNNYLSDQSLLYIFSDGPKHDASQEEIDKISEVRRIIRSEKWCGKVEIIEHTHNCGLSRSIINGVEKVLKEHGKIIVIEDDIITSVGFLEFLNTFY